MPSAEVSDTMPSEYGSSPSAVRVGDVDAGARQIDRGIEGVAAAAHAEASVAAAGHLDHDLADRDHTLTLLVHPQLPAHSPFTPYPRGQNGGAGKCWQSTAGLDSQQATRIFPKSCKDLGQLAKARLLYYNIAMSDHSHHHHHHHHHHRHAGHVHPPATVHPSILRMSVIERLAVSAVAITLIWLAVFWAIR